MTFDIKLIGNKYKIRNDNLLYKYLKIKTKSVDKGSKARKSLGNIYSLKVLVEDYLNKKRNGSTFVDLLERIRKKPFGSKIQNHPLDNRLNGEFKRKFNVTEDMLPVQSIIKDAKKFRILSAKLINDKTKNSMDLAKFIDETIETFIKSLIEKQTNFIDKIKKKNQLMISMRLLIIVWILNLMPGYLKFFHMSY